MSSLSFFLVRPAKRPRHANDHARFFLLGLPLSFLVTLVHALPLLNLKKKRDCLQSKEYKVWIFTVNLDLEYPVWKVLVLNSLKFPDIPNANETRLGIPRNSNLQVQKFLEILRNSRSLHWFNIM